jgi:hypothetical protein
MALRDQIAVPLSSDKLQMVDIIEKEFTKAGLPPEFAAAALVNAHHESGLNPMIKSAFPGENSVGLFQLNIRGAGAGMVLDDGTDLRTDPVLNTRRIIEEVQSHWGKAMRAAYESGERKISTFASLFSRDIERPADKEGNMRKRAETALKFFPSDSVKSFGLATSTGGLITIGIVSGVSILLLYYFLRNRKA